MKIDQLTLDWDWVKNIRAGSGVGMKIDRASVAFRAADAGHLDTILTVRNVLRNGCKRPSTTLYWARWQNRYIFIGGRGGEIFARGSCLPAMAIHG